MKKLSLLLVLAAVLIGCKPSIDSQLDKLEKQYVTGQEDESYETWQKLWDRQNEMSLVQVARFVKLTETYDLEWHYDTFEGDEICAVGVYMENRAASQPAPAPKASSSYSSAPKLSYYECRLCGLVVKSASSPSPINGVCHHRNGGTSHHQWAFLEDVGTQHIYSCSKCRLQIQTDKRPNPYNGTCFDGNRHNWQQDY